MLTAKRMRCSGAIPSHSANNVERCAINNVHAMHGCPQRVEGCELFPCFLQFMREFGADMRRFLFIEHAEEQAFAAL